MLTAHINIIAFFNSSLDLNVFYLIAYNFPDYDYRHGSSVILFRIILPKWNNIKRLIRPINIYTSISEFLTTFLNNLICRYAKYTPLLRLNIITVYIGAKL